VLSVVANGTGRACAISLNSGYDAQPATDKVMKILNSGVLRHAHQGRELGQQARSAVRGAVSSGFLVGCRVTIGESMTGTIIGYNIGKQGLYPGSSYPLLVQTILGVVKLGLGEVALN